MTFVLDASVIVKWLLQDPQREPDSDAATGLVEAVVTGAESVLQPPHWLVEVGAVLARASPDSAAKDLLMLSALEFPTADDPRALRRACGNMAWQGPVRSPQLALCRHQYRTRLRNSH